MEYKLKYLTEGKNGNVFFPFTHASGVLVNNDTTLDLYLNNIYNKVDTIPQPIEQNYKGKISLEDLFKLENIQENDMYSVFNSGDELTGWSVLPYDYNNKTYNAGTFFVRVNGTWIIPENQPELKNIIKLNDLPEDLFFSVKLNNKYSYPLGLPGVNGSGFELMRLEHYKFQNGLYEPYYEQYAGKKTSLWSLTIPFATMSTSGVNESVKTYSPGIMTSNLLEYLYEHTHKYENILNKPDLTVYQTKIDNNLTSSDKNIVSNINTILSNLNNVWKHRLLKGSLNQQISINNLNDYETCILAEQFKLTDGPKDSNKIGDTVYRMPLSNSTYIDVYKGIDGYIAYKKSSGNWVVCFDPSALNLDLYLTKNDIGIQVKGTTDVVTAINILNNKILTMPTAPELIYKGNITLNNLKALTSNDIKDGDVYSVYYSGNETEGWSSLPFNYDNQLYTAGTFFVRTDGKWTIPNTPLDISNVVRMVDSPNIIYLPVNRYNDTSFPQVRGASLSGLNVCELKAYLLVNGKYEPYNETGSSLRTNKWSVVVPFAQKLETNEYKAGVITKELLRLLYEHTHTWDSITNKPEFSAVSFTGSYNDLTNKPIIPDSVTDVVKYVELELTSDLKAIARSNIGAGTSNFNGDYKSLTNKPNTTVTPNLTSGTLIATIGGKNIYAPTANNLSSDSYMTKDAINSINGAEQNILDLLPLSQLNITGFNDYFILWTNNQWYKTSWNNLLNNLNNWINTTKISQDGSETLNNSLYKVPSVELFNNKINTKSAIEISDDPATAILGSDWRTPTKEEWEALLSQYTYTIESDLLKIKNNSNIELTIPLITYGLAKGYLTSNYADSDRCYYMLLNNTSLNKTAQTTEKYNAFLVRPVTDVYKYNTVQFSLTINGSEKKLRFAKSNLNQFDFSIGNSFGDRFAWGEIKPKTSFSLNNYRWYDAVNREYLKYTDIKKGNAFLSVIANGNIDIYGNIQSFSNNVTKVQLEKNSLCLYVSQDLLIQYVINNNNIYWNDLIKITSDLVCKFKHDGVHSSFMTYIRLHPLKITFLINDKYYYDNLHSNVTYFKDNAESSRTRCEFKYTLPTTLPDGTTISFYTINITYI